MNSKCVAALSAALALALPAGPVAASCLATPVEDDNPATGMRTGLAEPAANDLWVSGTLSRDGSKTYPYIERFDPLSGWSTFVLSSLQQSAFNSIAAFSAQSAIAVGFSNGGATALAVAFNGSKWLETLGLRGQNRFRGSLQKVVAVPKTTTAYAVLAYGSANMLYWSGLTWSAVSDALPRGGVLSVSARSADDVWAVGGRTNTYGVVHGLVERFDGNRWTALHPPAPLTMLTGVEARAADDVWVTGLTQQGSYFSPYAAHWNGSAWQQVALPLQNSPSTAYGDIYAESPGSAWIGATQTRGGDTLSSLWRWNGHAWRFVSGSVGWSETPMLARFPDHVWFAAGVYRRTQFGRNRWLGIASCTGPTS